MKAKEPDIELTCCQCGKVFMRRMEEHRYRLKKGIQNTCCSLVCAKQVNAKNKSLEEKRAEKAEYDRLYREKMLAELKRKKSEYYRRTVDREKERELRRARMPLHIEYCRQPEYKKWKKAYDEEYLAKKHYGDLWECAILLKQINKIILERFPDKYQRMKARGYNFNRTQKLKRQKNAY